MNPSLIWAPGVMDETLRAWVFHELYPAEDYATCGAARELELNRVMSLIRTLKAEFDKALKENDCS